MTKILIGINVLVFLINLAQGSSLTQVSGSLFVKGALYVPGGLDQGEWYRLITAAFLHASIIHLGMNMLVLWFIGAPVEQAIGRGRFLAIYIVSRARRLGGRGHLQPERRSRSARRARSSGSSAPRSSSRLRRATCSAARRSA